MNVGHPYDKMDLSLFYFDVAICDPTTLEAEFRHGEGSILVECNRSSIDQRGIQNPIKQPDKLLAVNYFRKTLYIRCLIGF